MHKSIAKIGQLEFADMIYTLPIHYLNINETSPLLTNQIYYYSKHNETFFIHLYLGKLIVKEILYDMQFIDNMKNEKRN